MITASSKSELCKIKTDNYKIMLKLLINHGRIMSMRCKDIKTLCSNKRTLTLIRNMQVKTL